jgi:hypothetical protein
VYVAAPSKRASSLQRIQVKTSVPSQNYSLCCLWFLFYLAKILAIHCLCIFLIYLLMILRDEDWEDNDGALNTISMTHPRIPVEHPNRFVVDDSDCHPLQPGIWLVPHL